MHIRWPLFQNIRDTYSQPYQTSCGDFPSYFSQRKLAFHKESITLFFLNIYKKVGSRGNNRIACMPGVVLDFDGKHQHAKTLIDVLPFFKRYPSFAYTTFSCTLETSKFYLILPSVEMKPP